MSKTAVSCANGKLLTLGVPPDDGAHALAPHSLLPARFQYTVFGAGKFIPEFPPQSPARVGEDPAAAPKMAMSLKSQSFADIAAAVIDRCVPSVFENTNKRLFAAAPATVNVPLII